MDSYSDDGIGGRRLMAHDFPPHQRGPSDTQMVCGTVLLLACICAILYMNNTQTNNLAALGIIGTIVASVLVGTFGLVKLSGIERKVDRAVEQTNGHLDRRIEEAVRKVLNEKGSKE